jgi:cytosine/adenosine deaminase-related metal-dependent hydrolase
VLSLFSAPWVLPVTTPPIEAGWVAVERGRIVSVGEPGTAAHREIAARADRRRHLDGAAILPAVINAHTHLELSWMRGLVPPAETMPEWVRALLHLRRASGDLPAAMGPAIEELEACGTAVVGDISNTLASVDGLAASGLAAVVFHEVVGFNVRHAAQVASEARARASAAARPPAVEVGLACHAPYSTSPALLSAVHDEATRAALPLSVHLGESAEEREFLATGRGPWRTLLDDLGAWEPAWTPPACGPVDYLDRLGFLTPGVVAVHGVQLDAGELARLAARGVRLVTCPRSNAWTGVGAPPIAAMYASGVTVAVGTDSLASAPDLNLFGELAAMRRAAPEVPARALIRSATLGGAVALGCADAFGSLEPGKRASLIAIALAGVDGPAADVEEAIVSGVAPDRISWLEAAA